jgi:hypothetical protein
MTRFSTANLVAKIHEGLAADLLRGRDDHLKDANSCFVLLLRLIRQIERVGVGLLADLGIRPRLCLPTSTV